MWLMDLIDAPDNTSTLLGHSSKWNEMISTSAVARSCSELPVPRSYCWRLGQVAKVETVSKVCLSNSMQDVWIVFVVPSGNLAWLWKVIMFDGKLTVNGNAQ